MTTESHIYINDILLHARHGVLPQERLTGNDYRVSLRAGLNISKAMQSDCVDDTVNYAALFAIIKEEMLTPSALIEHVAGRIARRIMLTFDSISTLSLSITKLNPPMGADCAGAGVEIKCTR